MSDLAFGIVARELALDDEAPQPGGKEAKAAEFDASRVFDREPISGDVERDHHVAILRCRGDVNSLEMLLTESKRELQDAVYYCNQKAWGYWDTNVGAPAKEQAKALLERMDSKFAAFARDAHHLRALCADVSVALEAAQIKAREDMIERSRKSKEEEDWAAFEAHEVREKQRRFKEWRENR